MSYALGLLGKRQPKSIHIRVPPAATYDDLVNSFGTFVTSYWKFQNTGTDEKGVANATINGSPELDVETIVDLDRVAEGTLVDGTCIAWPGTVAEYAQAAHNSAHKTAAGTIIVTHQHDALSQKAVLVAADSNGVAGGLSVEVNTNGSSRAFLRNAAAGAPITLTGTAGDVQVGQAYTTVFKWGSPGMSLSLWGDSGTLVRRVTNTTTDGASGTSTIRFGAWHDATSQHDGPYGRVIWLNRRISDGEEAILALSRTITHVNEPQPVAGELTVPSLAEFLKSDIANPGTITKYVSNQNRGNGSGSSAVNAQELQAALNGASAGQTFLAVCQTAGTIEHWNYPSGITMPSGNSGNLITLQARQGDGVVISAGQDFAGSRSPGTGFWTQSGLSSDDINKKIWKSANTFSGGAQSMMGFWVEFDQPHQLLRYSNMTNLRAAYGTADSPTNYATAGVHKDTDGTVYIRFQRGHPGKYSTDNKWSEQTWPGHPEAVSGGQIVYPVSENPNNYVIHLFRVSSNVVAFHGGQWFKIGAGINSMGYYNTINTNNVRMDRGTHLTWFNAIGPGTSAAPRTNIYCNRTRFTDGLKIHSNRAEWKFGGWLEPIRTAFYSSPNDNSASQMFFKDCTIGGYHELMAGGAHFNQFRYRNCTMVCTLDDGTQLPHNFSRVEFGYCYFFNAAWGGFGRGGSDGGDDTNPGNVFWHHNILDYRQERTVNWRAQPHPGFIYIHHSPDGRNPRKIYNNVFIFGPDFEEEAGLGFGHAEQGGDGGDNTLTGTSNMQEFFNNIVIRTFLEGTKRYDAISSAGAAYSDNFQNRSDFVCGRTVRYSAAHTNELFDYNCYWRPSGMSVDGLLRGWRRGTGQTLRNFTTLASWKSNAEFEHSKLSGTYRAAYNPGFDGNSTETKPTLPSIDDYPASRFNYRPVSNSVVTTAASASLSGANWWSTPPSWGATYFPWNDGAITLAPSHWKGALDPAGSTVPVGVQNP